MKKTLIVLFILTAMACGKPGIDADAEKYCSYMDQLVDVRKVSDPDKLRELQTEFAEFRKELRERYYTEESVAELEEKIRKCE